MNLSGLFLTACLLVAAALDSSLTSILPAASVASTQAQDALNAGGGGDSDSPVPEAQPQLPAAPEEMMAAAADPYDESRCRSADDPYRAPAWGNGTATGYLSDRVTIRDRFGNPTHSYTVYEWMTLIVIATRPHPIESVVQHTGGQTSLRFRYWALTTYTPTIQGGTVEVTRNGVLIDRDRLY